MTTYTDIPNGDIDQDSPITQPLVTALRDNPLSIAEGTAGAPVNQAMWHPYDMVLADDGNNGVIYDHSVDGVVSSVTSPSFEDGYEYGFQFRDMSVNTSADLFFELYSTALGDFLDFASATSGIPIGNNFGGIVFVNMPRLTTKSLYCTGSDLVTTGGGVLCSLNGNITSAVNTVANSFRIRLASGGFDNGQIVMFRRRELITG